MDPIKLITDRYMNPSKPPGPAKIRGHSRTKNADPDIENLHKIDAAMAISHAELGNIIISCREVLDEKRTVDMSDKPKKKKKVFEETVRLIDSAPEDVSVGRLSQLDTETPSRGDQEPPIDHANRLLRAKSIEEIIQNSQRYLKLKQELEIDQRLKEIAVLEKAAGSIRTASETAAESEARALIRRVKRMKTDLYNTLQNFTATRKYMSSARIQFKAIRDTMRRLESGIKEPPPFDASERPIDFHYDYHLPKKRAVDSQWWISRGFSWWANLAYSHFVQTSENLEEAIHMRQSRQAHLQDEASRLVRQLDEITERRSEYAKFVQKFEGEKKVSHDVKLRNKYFQAKRDIATVDDQLMEAKGRLSAYELSLAKLGFSEFIHKLMISMHTAARNILGHALADQQLQTGIYNELLLEKNALDKGSLREKTPGPKTKEMTNETLRTEGGLLDLSTKYTRSRSPWKRKEGSSLLMEMAQTLADFFRSPDISHLFRPDGWVFELHDLFRLVELALQDPPTEEEFMYFVQYCNDIEELFDTNLETQKVKKQKVGWERIDEAPIAGPKRVESIWGAPAGFEHATDFMVANGSDLHSDTDRDISFEALRGKWNDLAAVQVSKDKFQSYVDAWHESGKFIVILRLESDGLLLRSIDNGWQHLNDFPGVILPYPPLEKMPHFWAEVWRLIMEPRVASIWKARVQSGQVRTVMDFYAKEDQIDTGYSAGEPSNMLTHRLDRKGRQIHGNKLGNDEVTDRLSARLNL
ncbi:hypothetical protein DSL72_006017 [Monilinia vaccinii-corymbosi]|uniref:Uncharacterized protein n=1 Tax=Monilinia vaccinii-corymbosi TaxID=61207 RepID=A0A8A3PHA7_9HELO|nr:hypothetical protein DSL72_006017 [Monilinia vaccinii-corymbosi]